MDKKKRPRSYGFAGQRGYLEPPVQGPVVTAFGQEKKKFNLSHVSKGIDIRTVPGAEVTAIYDGKVVYAGHLRGYGNIIIIDHGQQYFSLLSRLGKILKQEGDPVSSGELIALMSDQRGLLGDGLHLEIRHGTDPIDPLPWFIPADETAVNSR